MTSDRNWRQGYLPLLLGAAVSLGLNAPALAKPKYAAMVIDGNTGSVLHKEAGDEPRYPASLTKIMTLYMVFEQIELGRLTYETKIKVSAKAAAVAPSKLDLEPGEEIKLIDAIKALVTKSANDVAVAVAEEIGGTEVRFAELMTKRAREIGLEKTTFKNASGLPNDGQVTTARDMLTLALRIQDDFPRHYKLFETRTFTYGGSTFRNHNTLLRSFQGADGIKTGYTRASGFNLISSVRRDGKHVVGVVFGGHSAPIRNANMRMLLTRGLEEASTEKTRKPALIAKAAPIPRAAKPQAVAKKEPPATGGAPSKQLAKAADEPKEAALRPATVTAGSSKSLAEAPDEPAEAAPKPPGTVSVARVRRVMVTPRVASRSSPAQTTEEPPLKTAAAETPAATFVAAGAAPAVISNAIAETGSSGKPLAAPASSSAPDQRPPDVSDGAARMPSTFEQQMAALAANLTPPEAQQDVGPGAAASGEPGPSPMKDDTAKSLDDTAPSPAAAAQPAAGPRISAPELVPTPEIPAPAAKPAKALGTHQVQIGAYVTPSDAERQLEAARGRAGALLAKRQPLTQHVKRGNQSLYRARFAGFDAVAAASTCAELQRLDIQCFVMKAE